MAEEKNTQVAKKEETSMSVRFMEKVMSEFANGVGEVSLTNFQKVLAQNYFLAIDGALKMTEEKRLKKSEKYRDKLAVTWNNTNMDIKFHRTIVSLARVGLDPAQPNHINIVPFKDNNINKYNIGFIEGYRGKEIKAVKYGLDVPDEVAVELVYSTDVFKPFKKSRNNPVETYDFEITNPFDRGEIKGGFYYHSYKDNPSKNKLVVFSLKDILKRKPPYASAEFWGGEKDKWEDGKKVGKESVEGWYEKMCWKTLYRACYGDITIDSQKIDDDYMRLKQIEESYAEMEVAEEIEKNANGDVIDLEYEELIEEAYPEDTEEPEPEQKKPTKAGQQKISEDGPGF